MPEFDRCMETAQNTKHHMYTVGEHTIRALCEIPSDPMLRLTMLLHDIAKPECRKTDVDGVDHFKGHAEASAVMADNILRRLKFDNDTRKEVVNLIRWHDLRPKPEDAAVRKAAYAVGPARFPAYLDIRMADNLAKSDYRRDEKLKQIKDVAAVYARILRHGDCLSLKDLAIGGADLLAMGDNGPVVGKTLHAALMEVLEHPEKNRIDDLLAFAREYAESESGAESGFESGSKSGSESESGLRGETDSADDPGNKKDVAGADAARAASSDKGEDTSRATSRRSGNAEASGKSSGRKKAGPRAGSGSAAGKPRKGGK
jgi:putative nucleotidyltransferase with HDIG domain